MKSKTGNYFIILVSVLILTLTGCKKNVPQTVCRPTAQQDGTMKEECKSNKQIPDAGIDRSKSISSRGSFVLFDVGNKLILIDQEITINARIKTDQNYISQIKLVAVRSKKHEEAAKLILQPSGNIYAFVPGDTEKMDKLIANALAKTKKSVTADMNYSFSFRSVTGNPLKITESGFRMWEKVPGQDLQPIPTTLTATKPEIITPPIIRIK